MHKYTTYVESPERVAERLDKRKAKRHVYEHFLASCVSSFRERERERGLGIDSFCVLFF
jgi:hypothetical protein